MAAQQNLTNPHERLIEGARRVPELPESRMEVRHRAFRGKHQWPWTTSQGKGRSEIGTSHPLAVLTQCMPRNELEKPLAWSLRPEVSGKGTQ